MPQLNPYPARPPCSPSPPQSSEAWPTVALDPEVLAAAMRRHAAGHQSHRPASDRIHRHVRWLSQLARTSPNASMPALPLPEGAASWPALTPGVKNRMSPRTAQSLGLPPDARLSRLYNAAGRHYWCTAALPRYTGSFGKVRYAIGVEGRLLIIKEVRTETAYARGMSAHKALKTLLTPKGAVRREVALLQSVEPGFGVLDVIDVHGKVHIIMNAMLGDFETFLRVPEGPRQYFVRSMMRQMAASITRCHALGYIHHDVKIENVFWDRATDFYLADYGLSVPHSQTHRTPIAVKHGLPEAYMQLDEVGPPGTYPAPEMCRPHKKTGFFEYDRRIDTWALGIAFVRAYIGSASLPFDRWRQYRDYKCYESFDADLAQYKRWYDEMLSGDGRLNAKRLFTPRRISDWHTKWDNCFRPALKADPKLFVFALRMLHPEAELRPSLQEVMAFCQQLLDEAEPDAIKEACDVAVHLVRRAQRKTAVPFAMLKHVLAAERRTAAAPTCPPSPRTYNHRGQQNTPLCSPPIEAH